MTKQKDEFLLFLLTHVTALGHPQTALHVLLQKENWIPILSLEVLWLHKMKGSYTQEVKEPQPGAKSLLIQAPEILQNNLNRSGSSSPLFPQQDFKMKSISGI